MARRVAVAIGCARVGGLPYLAAVAAGTAAFAQWAADTQGFEVVVHDDTTTPVTAQAIFKTIQNAVDTGDVERLFVFFSGHGMEVGTGDDVWLLSDAAEDPGAAVDVAKSVSLARHCGIPHVAFFADACRTPATIRGLTGRPIFPTTNVPPVRTEVDSFWATISGDPALEPKHGEQLFGIFTDCLLDALTGHERDLLTEVPGGPASHAVLARSLAIHLHEEVRLRSARDAHVTQTPDCIPTSGPPNVVSWVPIQYAESPHPPADAVELDRPPTRELWLPREPVAAFRADDRAELAATLATSYAARPGRTHFETAIGASVVGGTITAAYVDGRELTPFEEEGTWHVRVPSGAPASSALLQVEVGERRLWVATAVVPGHVATVTMGPEGAEHVAFIQIGDGVDHDRAVLSRAAAAARLGQRDFAEDAETGELLDRGNPTLAVLAAYAYDRVGDDDAVRGIAERCQEKLHVVPYDVAMLTGTPGAWPTVPAYPLMTRGWALADGLPAGEEWFGYARTRLAPAPWTTFTELDEAGRTALGERR